MNWRPLAICPDSSLRDQLRAALADMEGVEFPDYVAPAVALEAVRKHRSNLCFVESGTDPEKAFALIQQLSSAPLPVIAVQHGEDGPAILRCLRYGVSEFLSPPVTSETVAEALLRLASRAPAGEPRAASRVWCMMPGKGSCGCTTAAVNLAFRTAALVEGRVLLADFDMLTGSIGFHLNLKTNFSAVDALGEWTRMDDDLWGRLVARRGKVDVLLAPEDPVRVAPDAARLGALMELWRKRYAVSLVDCAAPSADLSLAAARLADLVLVVSDNEIASLNSTRRTLSYLAANGVQSERVRVVVSRYRSRGGPDRETVEKALRRPLFALLPNDFAAVQQRLLDGEVMKEDSGFGRAVAEMAQRLASPGEPRGQAAAGELRKFFGSFFKPARPRAI